MKMIRVLNPGLWLLLSIGFVGCDTKQDNTHEQAAQSATESAAGMNTNAQVSGGNVIAQVAGSDEANAAVHPGKALHDANCISCHDAAIYSRKDRKVRDFTQLAVKVERCDANLESHLSDSELEQVTEYLNQTYYQYTKQ